MTSTGYSPNIRSGLVTHILTPGSTTSPVFLLVVDGTIALLLLIFIGLLSVTGSLHFLALICITLALWASIKWYIAELRRVVTTEQEGLDSKKTE